MWLDCQGIPYSPQREDIVGPLVKLKNNLTYDINC
jgi:hypothetical protein